MPGWMKSCLKEAFTLVHTVISVVRLMVELLLPRCRLVVLPRPMQYALPADSEALMSDRGSVFCKSRSMHDCALYMNRNAFNGGRIEGKISSRPGPLLFT